jgi:hypothetical protein
MKVQQFNRPLYIFGSFIGTNYRNLMIIDIIILSTSGN